MANNEANFGYNILEATAFLWPSPMEIKHVILTFDQVGNELRFQAVPITGKDTAKNLSAMAAYAIGMVGRQLPSPFFPSPLDIEVKKQCWLLVQLDPTKNWQFTVGEVPCTLKEEDLYGKNVQLRHVYKDSATGEKGAVSRDGCQTIFFGVVQRGSTDGVATPDAGRCSINLNVEFVQLDRTVTKRLKLIVDPDVPNDGGTQFP